jgi:hypothetical protein
MAKKVKRGINTAMQFVVYQDGYRFSHALSHIRGGLRNRRRGMSNSDVMLKIFMSIHHHASHSTRQDEARWKIANNRFRKQLPS